MKLGRSPREGFRLRAHARIRIKDLFLYSVGIDRLKSVLGSWQGCLPATLMQPPLLESTSFFIIHIELPARDVPLVPLLSSPRSPLAKAKRDGSRKDSLEREYIAIDFISKKSEALQE